MSTKLYFHKSKKPTYLQSFYKLSNNNSNGINVNSNSHINSGQSKL